MQELNIKQKWICLVPSSKRNPGKEGAASGGKGKGQSPPQGASLPHSALRGPGASHKPRRRGAVEAHRLHEAGGTAFRAHGVQGARGAGCVLACQFPLFRFLISCRWKGEADAKERSPPDQACFSSPANHFLGLA